MSQSELTPFASEVLQGAVANLGVHEVGGANEGASVEVYQKFVGIKPGDAWCAAFVSYRLAAAAEKLGLKIELPRTGSSSEMYRWFLDRKLTTSQPAPGMVCFIRGGPTGHRHTCLVERVDSRHVLTIDGNEGDKVERAVHDRALCDYARLPA